MKAKKRIYYTLSGLRQKGRYLRRATPYAVKLRPFRAEE
jgi:hypothetical protein